MTLRGRAEIEKQEERLAPWAVRARESRGRLHAEDEHPYRTAFQRDRDRVLHSRAFRRLQYKTQVFVYHEGDHFRNRLTHTLEVAQIGRTVARALGANEDLCEAIVLAHDLGHTPFGHSGERALHRLLREHGGFEHNRQSLRIVDLLEVRSSRYRGLNLTHETRASVLKHGSEYPRYPHPAGIPELGAQPCAEAQIANCADEIAYHSHDIDDGLRSGILAREELEEVGLVAAALARARRSAGPAPDPDIVRARLVVELIDSLASDLIEGSAERLAKGGFGSAAELQASPGPRAVGFRDESVPAVRELADFLMDRFYRHARVARMGAKAERILGDLWKAYAEDPRQLPPQVLEPIEGEPRERALADYLAGMTDRFAMDEHRKLFDPHTHV